jgi:hypothetical protein
MYIDVVRRLLTVPSVKTLKELGNEGIIFKNDDVEDDNNGDEHEKEDKGEGNNGNDKLILFVRLEGITCP